MNDRHTWTPAHPEVTLCSRQLSSYKWREKSTHMAGDGQNMSLRDVIFGHRERATLQKALDSQEGQCPIYWRAMLSSVVAGHDAEDKNY